MNSLNSWSHPITILFCIIWQNAFELVDNEKRAVSFTLGSVHRRWWRAAQVPGWCCVWSLTFAGPLPPFVLLSLTLLQPHWLFTVSGTYQRVFRLRDLYILFFLLKFSSLVYLFVWVFHLFLVFCSDLTLSRLALSTSYNTATCAHLPHPVLFFLHSTYHILTYFIILPFFFFKLFAFGLPR